MVPELVEGWLPCFGDGQAQGPAPTQRGQWEIPNQDIIISQGNYTLEDPCLFFPFNDDV